MPAGTRWPRPSARSTRPTSRPTPRPASAAGPRPPSAAPCARAWTARAGTSTPPSPTTTSPRRATRTSTAVYAFLMTRDPVRATAPANQLAFPYNVRPLLAGWNLLFLDKAPFRPIRPRRRLEPGRLSRRRARPLRRLPHAAQQARRGGTGPRPRRRRGRGLVRAGPRRELAGARAVDRGATCSPICGPASASATASPPGRWRPVARNLAAVPEADVRAIAGYVASLAGPPAARSATAGAEATVASAEQRALRLPGRPPARATIRAPRSSPAPAPPAITRAPGRRFVAAGAAGAQQRRDGPGPAQPGPHHPGRHPSARGRGRPDDAGLRRGADRRSRSTALVRLRPLALQRALPPGRAPPTGCARSGRRGGRHDHPRRQRQPRARSTPTPTRRCSTCCATSSGSTAPSSAAASASAAPARCWSTAAPCSPASRRSRCSQGRQDHDRRGPGHRREARPGAARLHRGAGGAMRLLHRRHDHARPGAARAQPLPVRGRDPRATWRRTCAAAAPTCASCARSGAPPRRLMGGTREAAAVTAARAVAPRGLLAGGALVVGFSLAAWRAPLGPGGAERRQGAEDRAEAARQPRRRADARLPGSGSTPTAASPS